MKEVVVLYSKLSGYLINNLNTFLDIFPEYQLSVYHYPSTSDAPFQFESGERLKLIDRTTLEAKSFLADIKVDKVVGVLVSGWLDNLYLKACKRYRKKGIPVICAIDNPWTGSPKQSAAALLVKYILPTYYSHAWVSGIWQYEFARRLGFSQNKIATGFYAADTRLFSKNRAYQIGQQNEKKLVFVGRFVPYKWVSELAEIFLSIPLSQRKGWQLVLIGNGTLKEHLLKQANEDVVIKDFLPPKEIAKFAGECTAFCLPSIAENWGVVVQELAAAGLPQILSDRVGARTTFLIPGFNGFVFKSGSKDGLRHALIQMFRQSDESLKKMSENSLYLSTFDTSEKWAYQLNSFMSYTL